MAAGRHPPTVDSIARSSWRQALSGFITINSTNTNSVYKPDRDPDLCHRQLQHDAKGVARSGGCSPSSAAGHSASLEDEDEVSERGGEGRRWVVVASSREDSGRAPLDPHTGCSLGALGPTLPGPELGHFLRYNFIGII